MSDLTRRQLLTAAAGGALAACTSPGGTMSITVRPAGARGASRLSWLDSRHTFSFSDYFDPAHMGFRALRVINEDKVAPGQGFATHGHRDMEILSWVLDGELSHKDSMGNGSIIRPGELQRMSAGTGVLHSEYNPLSDSPVHFLQIWILPDRRGHAPSYDQKAFPVADRRGALRLVASPDGRDGSVALHQDVTLWAADLDGGALSHPLAEGRGAWVQVTRGDVSVNGKKLSAGDGAAIEGEGEVSVAGRGEVLLFDLA